MTITPINPPGIYSSPVFANAVLVEGGRTLYIGGQNGTDSTGELAVGIEAQAELAARNVVSILHAAGADLDAVVKVTINIVDGQDLRAAYGAALSVWGARQLTITVLRVVGLARPDALIEIDGIAILV